MNLHTQARTCPASRALLVRRVLTEHWSVQQTAVAAGVSRRTVSKWLARHRREGDPGLRDRSSRPHRSPRRLPHDWEDLVVELRRTRMTGPAIALRLKLPRSTVSRVLARRGLSRLKSLEPPVVVRRYEWARPGDMLHLDVKKLARIRGVGHRITGDVSRKARGIGWEFVHVCIDDASRVAYVEVLTDEKGVSAAAFLERALAYFRALGVRVRRVLTDNGSGYVSRAFHHACARLRLQHRRTRPYTPRTNGKAERFIQSMLRECAYRLPFTSSWQRSRALAAWVRYYNRRRPHGAIRSTPLQKLSARAGTTS